MVPLEETTDDCLSIPLHPNILEVGDLENILLERENFIESGIFKGHKDMNMNASRPDSTSLNQTILNHLKELGLRLAEDDYVKWRHDSTAHPRNWATSRKLFDVGLVLLLDLFTLVSRDFPP